MTDVKRGQGQHRKQKMTAWRKIIAHSIGAAITCSLLIVPSRFFGYEAAQAFLRLVDKAIYRSDILFNYVTQSEGAPEAVHSAQA